mmetsp:Transcript_35789/g.89294  ORF Transcript_35789/g.89294 Transcript_35789/m.89294 type:complete len:417 (-) Transcript_35789:179-1429(-)
MILPTGLVVNATHRFDLGLEMDHPRPSTSTRAPGKRPQPPGYSLSCATVHHASAAVYSYRFRYGANPKHTAAQILPLFCAAADRTESELALTLSSGCALFDEIALRRVPPSRYLAFNRSMSVLAPRVRLVVRHPDDYSRRTGAGLHALHVDPASFEHGVCKSLVHTSRAPLPEPADGSPPSLLYLPRTTLPGMNSSVKRLSNTGRDIDNEEMVLRIAAQAFGPRVNVYSYFSPADQDTAFARAEVVAGPQGTALSGLVYTTRSCCLVVVEWALQRFDTIEIINVLGLDTAYVRLRPHWYDTGGNKGNWACGGTCAHWHLKEEDIRLWRLVSNYLSRSEGLRHLGEEQARARRVPLDDRSAVFPGLGGNASTRKCNLCSQALSADPQMLLMSQKKGEPKLKLACPRDANGRPVVCGK